MHFTDNKIHILSMGVLHDMARKSNPWPSSIYSMELLRDYDSESLSSSSSSSQPSEIDALGSREVRQVFWSPTAKLMSTNVRAENLSQKPW